MDELLVLNQNVDAYNLQYNLFSLYLNRTRMLEILILALFDLRMLNRLDDEIYAIRQFISL
jgi:hypothetical protein